MGDAAVSALVKDVLGRLTSEVIKEFGLLWGFKKDVLALKKDFEQIQAVLEDAQDKQIKQKEVALWLNSVRSVSVKVENVLDDISTEAKLQRLHKDLHIKHHMISTEAAAELQHLHEELDIKHGVRAFFTSKYDKLMFHVKAAHKVKAVRRKLDAIKSRRSELGLTPVVISQLDVGVAVEMPDRETSSLIHDSLTIFGRDEEMEMVIKKICSKDIGKYENGEIPVYGIWGMGGLGKTTLAQLVYNHQRVKEYFELKCWVYVSEKFDVKKIIKEIITSIDTCECTLTPLETLQITLQDKSRGKKFLIVLDDVWIEDGEKTKWDELSKTLSCGIEGSIVLMTTRSQTTSKMFAKVPELQHNLGCLSQEDSWLLFKKFAFAEGREGDDISTLEPIGMEIVEKCKGLPLAVKTLGSLMWSKRSTRDWKHVKSSNIWELNENNILPALKLSYDNLLPHLKRCFAYCCLFPKGYELEKNVLVPLWVSNGFITAREKKSQYYLGEEIFNCLVWRSFFQVDGANRYKMHDLMHDLTQHVMGGDCVVIEPDTDVVIPKEVLHLTSSSSAGFLFSPQDLTKLTSLRSMLWLDEPAIGISQMYIRVLYLSGVELNTLPTSICKLKHLRYLNLSKSKIQVLPESIIYLQNLQVLILYFCGYLYKLPEGLGYMTNLQHLDIEHCDKLHHLPSGIKKLTSLRMLSKFHVGNKSGAKIGELEDLNLLEGELKILGLENVGGLNEAESANLKCKTNLSVLELWWPCVINDIESAEPEMLTRDEEVLNGLEPNSCLEKLIIYRYMGNTISPSWMLKLSNLVEITFGSCKNCLCVPTLGRLPKLRSITMSLMDSLKCFDDDDNNMLDDTTSLFPSLQKLCFCNCSSLVSLPSNLPKLEVLDIYSCGEIVSLPGNLPNIRKLTLIRCYGLLSLPDEIQSFKDLTEVNIFHCKHLLKKYGKNVGEDWPKISHIPSIDFL